jgi:homogentisate phytyltransferase/homogentisate geranylgeranyltransferase
MELHYKGVREGYPRLKKRFGKIAAYIQLCRVFTLTAPLLAGIFGVLTPVKDITFQYLYTAIYVGITLALAQATGQVLNQYADVELDKIIKSYRAIPSGLVSREEALGLSWLLAMFAVARAFTISTFFGLITLTLIFFAVFYSLAPLSPRRIHPLLNTGWMAFSRGFLPMFAVWSVYGDLNMAWPYSVLAFLWVFGFQASKDVPDMDGDKQFGIRTIPNIYGRKGLLATMLLCASLFMIATFSFKLYIMFLLVPVAIVAILTTRKQSTLTENTYSWFAFYVGVGLIYLLMFLSSRL